MKRFTLILAISFAFLGVFSQKYYKQQFTLFNYNCVVDPIIITNMASLESSMLCPAPEGYSKTHVLFVQSIFAVVKSKLEAKYGVYILPVNSYQNKVSYDAFGFPNILINTAIKKGTTKYYFKISAYVSSSSRLGPQNTSELWPVIKISIDLYNKDGYQPIKSVEATSEAVGVMKKVPGILYDLECANIPDSQKLANDSEALKILIMDAVENAIKKL